MTLPWRISPSDPRVILDADGSVVAFTLAPHPEIAVHIVECVNGNVRGGFLGSAQKELGAPNVGGVGPVDMGGGL